jgi:RNA polymerase sigma-70 factor (ECF subfamily)
VKVRGGRISKRPTLTGRRCYNGKSAGRVSLEDERGGAFRSEAPLCFPRRIAGPANGVGGQPVLLSIVIMTPLGSDRSETVQADAPERDVPRLVLLSDKAVAEQRLLESVRRGDRDAFGTLVQGYLPRALSLATRILRNREDAEDLVQDAFLSALKHIDTFEPSRPFWPWLSRIIVNRGFDMTAARTIRSTEMLGEDVADRSSSPANDAERSDLLAHVKLAMSALPPRRRLVVELFELEGFSVAEISEMIESTPATVRWHLHIARRQLRHALAHIRGASA